MLGGRTAGGAVEEFQAPYLAVLATRATAGSSVFPNGTDTVCPWDNIVYNPYSWTVNSSSNFVIPSGVTRVRCTATVILDAAFGESGATYVAIRQFNSSNVFQNTGFFPGATGLGFVAFPTATCIFDVVAGDYVRVALQQQSGSARVYNTAGFGAAGRASSLAIEVIG
jgi:hypothetical protein